MNDLLSLLAANYGWWLAALLLIGAEMIAPGYFLLWIGVAAGVMGIVTLVFPNLPFIVQAIGFAVLALGVCFLYWRYLRPLAELRNDQPLLNHRGARMIGQRYVVSTAIVNGRGKVKVGDSLWLAEGPDTPIGTEVEVVALNGTTLQVRNAPASS